jgi:Mlc titration factor MtfA (ptsG expression regulator)
LYENVDAILVYPSTVLRPAPKLGVFMRSGAVLASGPIALLGEAHHVRGPVVLAWDRVLRDGKQPQHGHNLVYHEFAHKLDLLDGHADGTPPLAALEERQRWHAVCERVFLELRARSERGEPTFLDEYGATNEAEFFAVATEHFFDQPRAFRDAERELYEVLRAFYRQDPAALERDDAGVIDLQR